MIVKISGSGSSFKGLAEYLTHDPQARTDERVAWTKTHNLSNEHVAAAVNEMYVTAESAEWLKQQAGVRAGGRPTENPVKHISLNWAEDDRPSREHMLASGHDYLRHMGWSDHQVIMVAHQDKAYAHLHMIINVIHPDTGKALDDGFEKRRSQEWALRYELAQDKVHCTQRLMNMDEREPSMPRNIWMDFKASEKEFLKSQEPIRQMPETEEYRPENRKKMEWEIFKQFQREERDAFYAEGKEKFQKLRADIYREVHGEFRQRWSEYYDSRRNAPEADLERLAGIKAQIIADEKAALEPRRDAACRDLRDQRDIEKAALNSRQREERAEFRGRLETGIDNSDFFARLAGRTSDRETVRMGFRQASHETTSRSIDTVATPFAGKLIDSRLEQISSEPTQPNVDRLHRRERDAGDLVQRGAVRTLGGLVDGVFSLLTNLGSAAPEPVSARNRAEQFREAAENALKQEQQKGREEDDVRWRERQKVHTRE